MIRKFLKHQGDLSMTTGAIFLVGLAASIFILVIGGNLVIPWGYWVASMALGAACAIVVLQQGRRLKPIIAVMMVTGLLLVLVAFSYYTAYAYHAVAAGMFLPIVGIYLMWFNRRRVARPIVYSILALYSVIVILRFQHEVYLIVFILILETVVASELIRSVVIRLRRASLIDPLTEVWNRRGLGKQLRSEIADSHRNRSPLSLLYVDLDDFKLVNDTQGHASGDKFLREFIRELSSAIRPRDFVARIGGDEFLVVLPNTSREDTEVMAKRLKSVTQLKWSYGIAQLRPGENADELISRADSRLLKEKAERKVGR